MSKSTQRFRRGGHTRGTRLVMVGASVGAFVLLLLSAFTSLPVGLLGPLAQSTRVAVNPAYESQAGDCLNWTKPDLSDVAKVDCVRQHLFEVTGVVDISATYGKDAPFPADGLWRQINQDHCASPSLPYLGGKLDPVGKYTVGPLNPGERRWGEGNRTLRCGLQVSGPSGGLLPSYGTAKTQDQSDVYDPGVCLGISNKSVGDPIDCAQQHAYEIVGVVDLGDALPDDFPASEKQDELLSELCAAITGEYTGGADLKAKGLVVAWDTRVVESWAAGSKKVNCKVGAVPPDNTGLGPWAGSVRNPNAPPVTTSNPPQTTTVRQDEPTGAPLHSQSNQSPVAPTSASSSGGPSATGQPTLPSR